MTAEKPASVAGATHRERAHPDCRCAACHPRPTTLPSIKNRRLAETMGDYRNIAAAQEGDDAALDDLAEVVCGTGGHIPPRDRDREACDFHRRIAAGYLRVVEAARPETGPTDAPTAAGTGAATVATSPEGAAAVAPSRGGPARREHGASSERLVERAADLWRNADQLDPGLDKGSSWSANARTHKKQRDIADHYAAYGVRLALRELGLAPSAQAAP